jgi:hypothetical protein
MRINGWRRLWIATAGLWALVVLTGALLNNPTAMDVPREEVLIERLAAEHQKLLKGFIPDDGLKVEFPNGHVLKFQASTTQDEFSPVTRAYAKVIQEATAEAKQAFWLNALLIWVAPIVLIYIVGEAVAWVRRGFGARVA